MHTVVGGSKPKFKVPTLATLYCTNCEDRARWMKTAELAVGSLKVGVLSITADGRTGNGLTQG